MQNDGTNLTGLTRGEEVYVLASIRPVGVDAERPQHGIIANVSVRKVPRFAVLALVRLSGKTEIISSGKRTTESFATQAVLGSLWFMRPTQRAFAGQMIVEVWKFGSQTSLMEPQEQTWAPAHTRGASARSKQKTDTAARREVCTEGPMR